jgi:hypothetical protein
MPACTLPPNIVAPLSAPASYASTFNATLWNAERVDTHTTLRMTPTGPKVTLEYTDDKGTQSDVATNDCGALATSKNDRWVRQYDNALALLQQSPQKLDAGVTWRSTVLLETGPTQTTEVPVTVRVVHNDASGLLLQATGDASGTLANYQAPFKVSYQGVALFVHGALQAAKAASQEPVQAGPYSQTLQFNWTLTKS